MWLKGARVDPSRFPDRTRYPFDLPVFRRPLDLTLPKSVTFFVGENGWGKTTLLEALVRRCGLHIWGSSSHHRLHDNPFARRLCEYIEVSWSSGSMPGSFFSAETFRDWVEFLDDIALSDPGQLRYFGGESLTAPSHGEATLAYLRARYRVPGVYFLDEPEAALSPSSQLELLRILYRASNEGDKQFVVATHSPIVLSLPGAQVLLFEGEEVRPVSYQDTAHFRLYREFLSDPESFLPLGQAGEGMVIGG